MEDDVVVRDVLRSLVIVAAQRVTVILRWRPKVALDGCRPSGPATCSRSHLRTTNISAKNMKRAGHAEMHNQDVAGGKIGEQIFRAPAEAGHRCTGQPSRKVLGQRPTQIAAANLDLDEAFPRHGRFEAAAHGFDFGQFGHRLIRREAARWLISNT